MTTLNVNTNLLITDASPLAALTNLEILDVEVNQITDISFLSGLTTLRVLKLGQNPIGDISALSGLVDLRSLQLYSDRITDISPLAGMTLLESLWLTNNQVSDIGPLAGLTDLVFLELDSNLVADLRPLANLISLRDLSLSSNRIADVGPLANFDVGFFTDLSLSHNLITDLSPLAGLVFLTKLELGANAIIDLNPLESLTDLNVLELFSNQLTDIAPLVANAGLGAGDTVSLGGNPLNQAAFDVQVPALEARGVTVDFTTTSAPTAASVSGTISDRFGAPVTCATVRVVGLVDGAEFIAPLDLEGRYRLLGLPVDTSGVSVSDYLFEVFAPGFDDASVDLLIEDFDSITGAAEVDLLLSEGAPSPDTTIFGRVVDIQDFDGDLIEVPLGGIRVEALTDGAPFVPPSSRTPAQAANSS